MLNNAVITNVTELVSVSSPKGRFEKINMRKYWGLSFCIEGQITYTHRGKKYISDKDHAIFLPQYQSYSLYGDKKGLFPVINFTCMNFPGDSIISIPIENPESYIKDYEQMKALSLFEGTRPKILSILYNIIYRLSSQSSSERMLIPAVKYIEQNLNDPNLNTGELAMLCHISESYFRRLFLKRYGTTPKQFIIDIRISMAKQLLTDGALKINAIAERCGYSNSYHFCRAFKEKTGLTPTEYMKQNRIFKI